MKRAIFDGQEIGTGETLVAKQVRDGVISNVLICYNQSPPGLELTLSWPGDLPEQRIDFVLVAPNDGCSFMAVFRYRSLGLEMVYSENSNAMLINALVKSKEVLVKEASDQTSRVYKCQLKHCFD